MDETGVLKGVLGYEGLPMCKECMAWLMVAWVEA